MSKISSDKNMQKRTYNRLCLGSYGVLLINNQTELGNKNKGQILDSIKWK